jgi:hypothetical protein
MKRSESENRAPEPKAVPLEVVEEIPNTAGASKQAGDARHTAKGGWAGSSARFILTLAIAAVADGLEVLFPPFWIPIDLVTVGAFFLLWGFRWEVAVVLLPEVIPGANVFPSWILLALYLGNQGDKSQRS